jgi:nuclear cap-binding protein subunit 1
MRRALELEIRLSYYDRIMKTLPEAMQSIDAGVMPAEAPGYDYEYESSSELPTLS